jgi:hypothetical protein
MQIRLVSNQKPTQPAPPGVIYVDVNQRTLRSSEHTFVLTPLMYRVLMCFLMNLNKNMSMWEIFYAAWDIRQDPDGGPLNVRQVVDNMINKLREPCALIGIPIINVRPHGWHIKADPSDVVPGVPTRAPIILHEPLNKYPGGPKKPTLDPVGIEEVAAHFELAGP